MTERRHILKGYDNYIDGNTVRKHAEVTKRQERIDRKIVTSRKTLRNREKATRMNLGAVKQFANGKALCLVRQHNGDHARHHLP